MASFSSLVGLILCALLFLAVPIDGKKSLIRGVARQESEEVSRELQKGKKDGKKGKKGKNKGKKKGKKGGDGPGDDPDDGTITFQFTSDIIVGANQAGGGTGDVFELRKLIGATSPYGNAYLQFGPFSDTQTDYTSEVVTIDPNECYIFVARDRHNGAPFGYPPSEISYNGGPFTFCTGECNGCGGDIETCEFGDGCSRRMKEMNLRGTM